MSEYEHVIPLPEGRSWVVIAYEFPTPEQARIEWERIEFGSRGQKGDFSIWRTMTPDKEHHYIVVCGAREKLPEVRDGTPAEIDPRMADDFALRRARTGLDAIEAGEKDHIEQRMRYGEDTPVRIDPGTGRVRQHRW